MIELGNMDLRIRIEQLEIENKILRNKLTELNETVKHNKNSIPTIKKSNIKELIMDVEMLAMKEEITEDEIKLNKQIASLTERNKKILIALDKFNGLNRDQLIEMFFDHCVNKQISCTKIMNTLESQGHVRINRKTRPFTAYSKHKFGPANNEGYVYIVKEFHTNTYKIGKTKNLTKRLNIFDVKLPFRWELINSIKFEDYSYGETLLHRFFSDKRIDNTEWYDLSEDDLRMIVNQQLPEEIRNIICG